MWKISVYDERRKAQKTVKCNANSRQEAEALARVLELIYANKSVLSGVSVGMSIQVAIVDGESLKEDDITFEEALLWVLNGKAKI